MINKKRWIPNAIMSAFLVAGISTSAQAANENLPQVQTGNPGSFYNQGGGPSVPSAPADGGLYQAAPQQQGQQQQQQTTVQQNTTGMPIGAPGEINSAPQAAPQNLPPLPGNMVDPNANSFNTVKDGYLSVTPSQIRQLRQDVDERQRAASELPGTAPKPVTGSVTVSLSPGSVPSVIRPYMNHTTSFVVVDRTGAPWPVENFKVGNKNAFTVERLDADSTEGSSFTIDTKGMYVASNLILKLKGVPTPVVIDLISGQKFRDERVEVRVASRGPNASIAATGSVAEATDSRLLPVLDGIAPERGKQLKVVGGEGTKAWLVAGKMVVRTPYKIISPASRSFVSSSDGTNVYVFTPSAQLVASAGSEFINISIQGW